MAAITIELVMVLALVLLNGLLAMAEFALVSARKTRLQQLAERGDTRAQTALELAENPTAMLSTVQVGITLVGVLAGAFGGATISEALAVGLARIPLLAQYSQGLALALVVMAITLLSLVIGELAPKRLALNNPERSALLLARPMQRLSRIAAPLVRLLEALTDLVLRVLGVEQAEETPVSEEEIKVIIAEATASGVFFPAEQEMLSGVIRLGDRRVGSLITPRTEIEWLDLDDPYDAQLRTVLESSHSRFPVGRGSLDEIQGVVLAKSVLAAGLLPDRERDLSKLVLEPLFVPENTSALQVLDALRKSPAPLVLVIDEYGGVQGLVTLSDLLASIINDLPLLEQSGEREIVVREDGSLLVDGMLPVDELVEQADVPLPVEGEGEYQTVGGLVMYCLGRVPAAGDRFELGGYRFEVMDMDGLRVDKVLIRRSPEQAT